MTFQTFEEFREWCENTDEISVVEAQDDKNGRVPAIIIGDLNDTNGMIVCEVLVSAYDSGFIFGPMDSEYYNGSLMIAEE